MQFEQVPTPNFITVHPASQGRVQIDVSIATPEDCREAALWFLAIEDRFNMMLSELHAPEPGVCKDVPPP